MSLRRSTSETRSSGWLRAGATVAISALTLTLLSATPAFALPIAEVPANTANWSSTPYSPLQPGEIAAAGNNKTLTFDGTEGGLNAGGDVATGFTMVQPSTADPQWYQPENLDVSGGKLNITATKGIAYLHNDPAAGNGATRNQQDNTMGVGLSAAGKILRLSTTVTSPVGAFNSAQAGLWFGPNDDNFLKFVVAAPGATAGTNTRQIQLAREVGALSPNTAAYQVNVDTTTATIPDGTAVTLQLDINALTGKANASYRLGTGAFVPLAAALDVPANFFNGSLLTGTALPGVDSFGGVFATKRNVPAATPLVYSFDSFAVSELDTVPPAAPTNLIGQATPGGINLGWAASAASDVAGYRVYRSTTAPVSTTGTPFSGNGLITGTTFGDSSTFIGVGYHYAVTAVDTSGNVSPAVQSAALTSPSPEGTPVAKVNFSTTAGPTVVGYTNDTGLGFDSSRGFGWITGDDGVPFDFSLNGRVRTNVGVTTDQRLASLVHMQYGDTTNPSAVNGVITEDGVWEYVLPDGTYNVVAAAGDSASGNYDSTHVLNAEGVPLLASFAGTSAREYDESAATVEVTDGKLTIDAEGGTNSKINYIEIFRVAAAALPAPADLSAVLNDDNGVDLTWQGVNGASGYNVFRGTATDVDTAGSPLNAEPLTGTSFTDDSVEGGTTYHYVVVALGENASGPSQAASVSIPEDPTAPATPANVVGVVNDSDHAVISWDAVVPAASYDVFRADSASVGVGGSPVNTVPLTTTSFTDSTAEAGKTYHYVVVAVGADGLRSAPSSPAVQVVIPEEPVVPGQCIDSQWSVDYFAGTDLAGSALTSECVLEINQTFNSGDGPVGVGPDQYSARFTKVIDEGAGTYKFSALSDDGIRVRVDGALVIDEWYGQAGTEQHVGLVTLTEGEHVVTVEYYQGYGGAKLVVDYEKLATGCTPSEWSVNYFSGTNLSGAAIETDCVADIDQTSAPAGVGPDQYSARFTKIINEGAGTYRFSVFSDDGVRVFVDGVAVIDEWYGQGGTEEHVGSVTLTEGEHVFTVEYYQAYGGAKLIVDYERTGSDTEAPNAPTELVSSQGTSSIRLDWEASSSSDTVGYRLYRGTAAGVAASGTPLSGSALLTAQSYVDSTAVIGATYYYVVTAVDAAGNESAVSNEAVGMLFQTPDNEAPAAPTALAATGGDGTVTLAWTASASADTVGYLVYRALEPSVLNEGDIVSGAAPITEPTYTDTTVSNGTTYFYVVVAVDLAGNESAASNEVFAVPLVPNTTDVKVDFTATNGVPAAGYVADWGQAYGPRNSANQGSGLSYGWIDADGNVLNLVGNGRDRGRAGVEERVDSMIHMQYGDVNGGTGTNGVKNEGQWELAVPQGLYQVTVAVGDEPGAEGVYDSNHVVNIEGSVGIESYVATAGAEYKTVTTTVGVWDGKLTVDAEGGTNTKLGYVDVKGIQREPHVDTVLPENRSSNHDVNAGVSATIRIPYAGVGVNPLSLPNNVKLFELPSGTEIPTTVGTSGGNDVISLAPNSPLKPSTSYRFVVTSGVLDNYGAAFVPFASVFTTGTGEIVESDDFTPATNIAFEKVELPIGAGTYWSSFTFGPDNKLYAASIGEGLYRFTVNNDGTLSNKEDLGYQGMAMIGLVFDKSATAGNLKLWVTTTTANFNEQGQWVSGISMLTGPNLATRNQVFSELPRSLSDHLTNSMAYGPDGRIYFQQGSNQASGDLDNSWGQRGEQLLTAATLVFDPANSQVAAAAAGGGAISVKTAQGGTYNPYAPNSPLKIFASGIRNAYDLVWHSNGHLYVATNGTAGGANTPGVTANPNGTFTREAAAGIPGFSTVDGTDVTPQCVRRGYTGGSVPPIANQPTQRDLLFDVVEGGYYGHPNPTRCEFVLNEGNDPANPPKSAGQGGSKYPLGTKADPNYRGIAYDFEFNKSPNGSLEYKSATFGGQLKGRLVITRFSNNNDLIFLQPDPATGKILGAQTEVGITGVANTTMQGVGGFNDPLEVVEDTRNGNLYVNQYDRSGSSQKLYLLRVPASQQAAKISTSADEMIFSAVKSTTSTTKNITVTNGSSEPMTLSAAVNGANAAEFAVVSGNGAFLAPGASATVGLQFKPSATVGQRSTQLVLTGGTSSLTVGVYGLTMNGIEGGNEPTLQNVLGTLGHNVDVGWTNLEGGVQPTAKGDEVLEPLFVKSGTGSVSVTPLAHYAPRENIPFGWYTGDGAQADRHEVGAISTAGYQSLLPPVTSGSATSFDPGSATFGLYYYSGVFQRFGFTEDRLNTGIAHRARVYPAKNRSGVLLPNSYIVAFEDASNGDYQDYLFLVKGLKPVTDTGSIDGAVRVDFTTAAGDLAAGYLRDYGQAYAPRTGADQGSGLTFGWKDQVTENDINLSVGGTTPGNGRDRGTSQPDVRLDSFMHMQSADVSGTFNGTVARAFWELALPNGEYAVTVAVGDPAPQTSDPEIHQINLENSALINLFTPTGAAGAATRHTSATKTVSVTDGALTVDAIGGRNTKISYIDVVPVEDTGGDDPTDGAQVKVAFQTAAASTPDGWTAETGAAYSDARGFGWLNAANGQPVDRTVATRTRTAPMSGIAFPADPLLKSFAFLDNESQPTYTNGIWEYKVPNGTYEVAVSVGDANYLDSTHGVTVEGQPIVASFLPTATTPFQTGVRDVTVTDGKMTIANSGTNTKINWVSIKGEGLDAPAQPVTKINFQPSATTVPSGWLADTGAAYSATPGFGWLVNGQPADRSANTRHRTTATSGIAYPSGDVTRQTLILTQATSTAGTSDGVWEYAVANGTYTVSVSVGDSGFIDSVHGVSAEGSALITGFTPTNGTPFASGTATVIVADGKLTLNPTGTNTKFNWVTIQGAALAAPTVGIKANGADVGTTWTGGTANVTVEAAAGNGDALESLVYSVNGGAATPYTGAIVLDAVGNYVLTVTATDSDGRQTVREVQFEVLNIGGTLTLRNQQATRVGGATTDVIPGFREDTLVLHRINAGKTTHATTESGTVNLTNTGTKDLRISNITLGGANPTQFEIVDPPVLPLLIAPGATVPLTAKFISTSGSRGVRTATVNITSSDPAKGVTAVQLRGGYMTQPEGGSELTLPQIIDLFGWTTNVGPLVDGGLGNGSENPGAPLNGEEVRSNLWKRLDAGKPVQVRQLAAFHGCCTATETVNVNGTSATHNAAYGQGVLPLNNALSGPTQLSTNPGATSTFGIVVAGQSTNNNNYRAVKTWPVRDANGKIVSGSWIVGHDYISSPSQCGISPTNCDFQDNVYLISNVLPVASSDTVVPTPPSGLTGSSVGAGVDLSWNASAATDVAGYRIERATAASGPWATVSGTAPILGTTFRDAALPFANTVYYRVVAMDASGNVSAPNSSTGIDISSTGSQAIRINAGGGAVTTNGTSWLADTYFVGGKTYTNPAVTQIAGTTDDAIYLSERSALTDLGTFGYDVPVPNGTYTVKLHFAELYWGATGGGAGGTGKRVFSANFEGGTAEITGLDLNARVGSMAAYVTTNTVTVTDGVLDIDFAATTNQPKVSAIEIIR
ncbi:malectin domain-containing carbohydrate-binding protein [Mycetocola zhadangensis]|uniref:malectin domain-containing carbohydrate-binding protein n=1 Tax=Mycetocola zhadangensis TaxID=1164595 RepID=UPI003A4E2AA5